MVPDEMLKALELRIRERIDWQRRNIDRFKDMENFAGAFRLTISTDALIWVLDKIREVEAAFEKSIVHK